MVVVRRHGIAAVTVQVEPDGVERYAELSDYTLGRFENHLRRRGRCGIEAEIRELVGDA
jgi:hypothetical protein